MVAAGAIYASSGDDGRSQGANPIIGSWEVTVDRGPQLPPVKGLTTFTRGHSLIGTGNTLVRGPSHGAWEHVSGRLYADTQCLLQVRPDRHVSGDTESQRKRAAGAGRRLVHDGFDLESVRSEREPRRRRIASDRHRDADPHRPDPGSAVDPLFSGRGPGRFASTRPSASRNHAAGRAPYSSRSHL